MVGGSAEHQHVIEAITEETTTFLSLFIGLAQHDRFPLVAPGLMPHMAMYVLESRRALGQLFPEFAAAIDDEAVSRLSGSRKRAKLLDDRDRSVEQIASELAEVGANQTAFFLNGHSGALAPLMRALQPDLGISMCNGSVFSTTHFSAAILGWERGVSDAAMSRKVQALGYSVGKYASSIWEVLGAPMIPAISSSALSGEFGMRDLKSPALYRRSAFGQMSEPLSIGATTLLASLNLVQYILGPMLPHEGLTSFKLKLITAYHADSNLKYMQGRLVGRVLCSEASDLLRTALGNSDSRWLRRQGALRNILVHYLADESSYALAPPRDAPRRIVLEQLGGASMADMTDRLDRHILRLSRVLEDGFDLHGDPFSDGAVN